jgi:hypothetical protein
LFLLVFQLGLGLVLSRNVFENQLIFLLLLDFFKLYLLLVGIRVKDIEYGIGSSHEIRMSSIDVGILNNNQIFDHFISGVQTLL